VSPMRSPGVQRYVAAAELGSGEFVNPVVPEDAAAALRGA
jgi:galactose-1-phosphate uridylyltransferase